MTKLMLMGGVAMIAVSAGLCSGAYAQQSEKDDAVVEEIEVTGIRRSLSESIDKKRNAATVVDAISSTDLGRFPDENVAEALQRVTGVQINRIRGEGSSVNIRGFNRDFSQVLLNGNVVTSASDAGATLFTGDLRSSRVFDFTMLASDFVRSLEVYKGSVASIEEGGLAGTINVSTPRPLEIGERVINFTAQGVYQSNSGRLAPRVSGIYSDVFADGKWGVTLAAAVSLQRRETHQSRNTGGRDGDLDFDGDGDVEFGRFIDRTDVFLNREERDQYSLLGTVQFEPQDNLTFTFDSFYVRQEVDAERSELIHLNFLANNIVVQDQVSINDVEFGANTPVAITQLNEGNFIVPNQAWEDRQGETFHMALNALYETGPWTIKPRASYSRSLSTGANWQLAGQYRTDTIDSIADGAISLIYPEQSQAVRLDPSVIGWLASNNNVDQRSLDRLWDMAIDVTRDISWDNFNASIDFGAKYTERTIAGRRPQLVINNATFENLTGSPSLEPWGVVVSAGSGDILGAAPSGTNVPNEFLSTRASDFARSFTIDEAIAAGADLRPRQERSDNVSENIFAFYASMNVATDDDRLSGNFGIRVINTDQTSFGVAADFSGIVRDLVLSTVQVPTADEIFVTRDYWNVLPSVNLRYNVSDEFVVRFGASRTMTRPDLPDLSANTDIRASLDVDPRITRRNPNLDPFISDNFDLSFEYYFEEGAAITVGLFQKELVSLVAQNERTEVLPITEIDADGNVNTNQPTEFIIAELTNGEGASVRGLEFSYQQPFTMLPAPFDGLGVVTNYTYIDVDDDSQQLTQVSEHQFTVSGYYEKGPLSIRLAYTWRDEYDAAFGTLFGTDRIVEAYGSLDGNITYDINDDFSIVLEAVNIADSAQLERDGNGFPHTVRDFGTRILFGLRGRF